MQSRGTPLLYSALSRFNDAFSAALCHSHLTPIALKASDCRLGGEILLAVKQSGTNSDGLQKASLNELAKFDGDGYGDTPFTSVITRQAPCSGPLFI